MMTETGLRQADRQGNPSARFGLAAFLACALMSVMVSPATAQVSGQPAPEIDAEPRSAEPEAPVVGEDGTGQDRQDRQEPAGDDTSDIVPGPSTPVTGTSPPREPAGDAGGLNPFAAMLTRRGPSSIRFSARTPRLYSTTEGDETFIFQTDSQYGFIRFPCDGGEDTLECDLVGSRRAEEIIILDAIRSPRGDVIYADQSGQAVLRVTSNGGATLFTPEDGVGAYDESIVPLGGRAVLPVNRVGGTLTSPPMAFDVAAQRMREASELIAARHGAAVTFMAPGTFEGNQAVLADAVLTTAKGIDLVASDPLGARIIAERLAVVEFMPDAEPSLTLREGVLSVRYNPAAGLAGRPSSLAVRSYLENAL